MLGMLGPSPVLLVLLSFFRRCWCQWTTQQPDDPFFYFSFLSFVAVFVQETAQQQDDPFFYFSFRSFVAVVVKETTQQLLYMILLFVTMISVEKHVHIQMYVQVLAYIYIYKTIWHTFEQTKMRAQAKQQSGQPQILKKAWCGQPQSFAKFNLKRQMNQSNTCFWQENNNAVKKSLSGYENIRKSKKQWKIKLKKAKFRNFLLSF